MTTAHEHRYNSQVLRHAHPGGDQPHGYFGHPEDLLAEESPDELYNGHSLAAIRRAEAAKDKLLASVREDREEAGRYLAPSLAAADRISLPGEDRAQAGRPAALRKIRHESEHSMDPKTRRRLSEALTEMQEATATPGAQQAARPLEPGEQGTLEDLADYLEEGAREHDDGGAVDLPGRARNVARALRDIARDTATGPDPIRARWVCGVVRSGYHNGAWCTPAEPHGGWGCGWRYEISLPASPDAEAFLRGHGFSPHPAG